ncbi:MAG: hypothetical protein H7A25_09765 [Leptospiraceae bacterium]|nr:hypothetical protein [Leptospiraceae bacterium]MCP5500176.1 hypothetical protein [Leptospiraceae bacterium]
MLLKVLVFMLSLWGSGLFAETSGGLVVADEVTKQKAQKEMDAILQRIQSKIAFIEKVHSRLILFDKDYANVVLLKHKTAPELNSVKAHKKLINSRYTVLKFEGEKVKEIEIVYKESYLNISWEYENKKLLFYPEDYKRTIIYTDGTSHNYITDLDYFDYENRVKILKKIELNMIESSYKLEHILYKYETHKAEKEKKQMELY